MNTRKQKLFIIISIVLVILLIVFVIVKISPPQAQKIPVDRIIPSVTAPLIQPLQILSVNPPENTQNVYFPITQIEFTFNQVVHPTDFIYEITPKTKVEVFEKKGFPTIITISPEVDWPPGITTITITSSAQSLSGRKLNQSFRYRINTDYPKNPPADKEY